MCRTAADGYCGAMSVHARRQAMKVALAPRYRSLMWALLPSTLGLGTAVLWMRNLNWPLRVDADGITLRCYHKLSWASIHKICVSRSYLDGHASVIRIHHRGGVSRIPVGRLQDGQNVVRTILTMFAQAERGS